MSAMNQDATGFTGPLQPVYDFHQATRHRFEAFARGPGFLDCVTLPAYANEVTPSRLGVSG